MHAYPNHTLSQSHLTEHSIRTVAHTSSSRRGSFGYPPTPLLQKGQGYDSRDAIALVADCSSRVHLEVDWWWMLRLLEETNGSIDHLDPFLVSFISGPSTMESDATIAPATVPADSALQNLQTSPDVQVLLAALYILVHETKRSGRIVTLFRRPQTLV